MPEFADHDETAELMSEPAAAHDTPAAVEEERAEAAGGELGDGDHPVGRVDRDEPGPYSTPPADAHGPTLVREDDPR